MTPFAQLTYDQQLERFTQTARHALIAYDLVGADVQPIQYKNNVVFAVTAATHQRYVLRLHLPGHKRDEWIRSELIWLTAIRGHAGLQVPLPVKTLDGKWLTHRAVEGLDEPVTCVLFEWMDGRFYDQDTISLDQVKAAGAFLAALHQFSQTFVPPADFQRPKLDWEGVFGEDSLYNPGEGARIFTPEQIAVFAEVDARVRAVMETLGQQPHTFGLIHADFLPQNILFNERGVGAIDFDDCAWGYYLYDLSPALWQFKFSPRYSLLRDALIDGYDSVTPISTNNIRYLETFVAARHLASCRWQAGHLHHPRIRERAPEVIAQRTEGLKRFLSTGRIG
jgi:Ser/Thr protein kinase RdoA (MazF antagonist)